MSLDMWKRQAMDVKDRIKQAMMKHNDTNFDPSVSYSFAQTNWRHQDFNIVGKVIEASRRRMCILAFHFYSI